MLSKNQIKLITSLQKKKYRDQHKLFVAEGNKLVSDLLSAKIEAEFLIYTNDWNELESLPSNAIITTKIASETNQIKKISSLKTPPNVIGVFKFPNNQLNQENIKNGLSLILDDVQDPGNLGTIIRIADWFGIKQIFCSPNTVDLYNSKVVQATMGAISSVSVIYTPLKELILQYTSAGFPIYGTFLEGETIYNCKLQKKGFIVMGNEGKGVSKEIQDLVSQKLYIPDFPNGESISESLNVAVATSIICSEFRRQEF